MHAARNANRRNYRQAVFDPIWSGFLWHGVRHAGSTDAPLSDTHSPSLMAFDWIIDSRKKLIIASAEGEFTFTEVWAYLAAVAGANALNYRQLFDLSQAFTQLTPAETMELGVRMRMQHSQSVAGPVAVVMPEQESDPVARLLGIMATAERPMRLFNELEAARQWIDGLAGGPSADERQRD